MSRAVGQKRAFLPFPFLLFIAIVFDGLDYIILGLIPILGDILDVFATVFFFLMIGPTALLTLGEFASVTLIGTPLDLIPSYTIAVLVSRFVRR